MISSMDLTGSIVTVRGRDLPNAMDEAAYVLETERVIRADSSVCLRVVSCGCRKAPSCLLSEEREVAWRCEWSWLPERDRPTESESADNVS